MSLIDSDFFIASDNVLALEDSVPLYKSFERAYHQHAKGLVLTHGGRATRYVETMPFAKLLAEGPLVSYSQRPIGDAVAELHQRLGPASAPVDLATVDLQADALTLPTGRVFEVYQFGSTAGWFVQGRRARAGRVIWICEGPIPHTNTDPDHGTCYSCPFKVNPAEST